MALATTLSQTSVQAWTCPFRYDVVAIRTCEIAIMSMFTADMAFLSTPWLEPSHSGTETESDSDVVM